jgi:hypothetical protein
MELASRGADPHGVSVSDDRTFMRWQSAPNPEVAQGIWRDLLEWLEVHPEWVLDDPEARMGTELLVRRIENDEMVATRTVRVGGDA